MNNKDTNHKKKSKKHEFMKYDLDSNIEFTRFDLKEENEEGHFDKDDFYIPKKEEYDPWYESVIEDAKKNEINMLKKKREKEKNEKNEKEEEIDTSIKKDNTFNVNDFSSSSSSSKSEDIEENYSKYGEEDLYYKEEKITKNELNQIEKDIKFNRIKLSYLLNPYENVNQAIRRLKPKQMFNKQNKYKKNTNTTNTNNNDNNDTSTFNELLNIVSKLTELSYFDVYYDTIEKISDDYGYKDITMWKYKTVNNKNEEQIFGDFTKEQMEEWINKKYFESNDNTKFYFALLSPGHKQEELNWITNNDLIFKKYFT